MKKWTGDVFRGKKKPVVPSDTPLPVERVQAAVEDPKAGDTQVTRMGRPPSDVKDTASAQEAVAARWAVGDLILDLYEVKRIHEGGGIRVLSEYVEGGTLEDWIISKKLYEGGSRERILDIAIQMAWDLDFAHEQGLVHQDVKPANTLLPFDGRQIIPVKRRKPQR